jgi:hypothetical protein
MLSSAPADETPPFANDDVLCGDEVLQRNAFQEELDACFAARSHISSCFLSPHPH